MDLKEIMNFVKKIEFYDDTHEEHFNELLARDATKTTDTYRKALFYIISGNDELYTQADKIYNFDKHNIGLENYRDGKLMLTGGTNRMVYLAYHLYNGFSNKHIGNDREDLSILDIFSGLDIKSYQICMNAMNIRFGRMK